MKSISRVKESSISTSAIYALISTFFSLLLSTQHAFAAYDQTVHVSFFKDVSLYNVAQGAVGAVRNDAQAGESISCSYDAVSNIGKCMATDVLGTTNSCVTSSPELIKNIAAINNQSVIRFYYVPNSTNCKRIEVVKSSAYKPPIQ